MELLIQVIIALATTSLGSVLAYFSAVKNAEIRIEGIKINSDTELNKIKEESKREIDKIRVVTEEKIKEKTAETELAAREKEESLKYEAVTSIIKSLIDEPQKGAKNFKILQELSETISH